MSNDLQRPTLKIKERKILKDIVLGNRNPNTKKSQEILNRPHVAVALEVILDNAGLTDEKLADRLGEIVNRKPSESVSARTGAIISNIASIDSNALNAIRTIWQARGRFTTKEKSKYGLEGLSDSQLDSIIEGGISITSIQKRTIERNTDKGDAIDVEASRVTPTR